MTRLQKLKLTMLACAGVVTKAERDAVAHLMFSPSQEILGPLRGLVGNWECQGVDATGLLAIELPEGRCKFTIEKP